MKHLSILSTGYHHSMRTWCAVLFAAAIGFTVPRSVSAQLPAIKVLDGVGTISNPTELKGPYIELDPFDLVYLDKFNKFAILKVVPQRKPPTKPFPNDEIMKFDFPEDSEYTYQVPFARITDYRTYNDLLIEEAEAWLAQKDYASALRNLLYVYDNGGSRNPKIVETLNTTLFKDATENFRSGRFELSLSIYEDIYQKNPDWDVPDFDRSLGEIIIACYQGILQRHFEKGEYLQTRNLLTSIQGRYPDQASDLITSWNQQFADESDRLMAQAKEQAAQGNGRAAHLLARRANTIFPGRKENTNLYDEIVQQYPFVFIGVNETSSGSVDDQIENWGSRRINRLTQRKLFEFTDTSDEGGRYGFLAGQIKQADEIGLKFQIDLESDTENRPQLSAYEVAARLAAYADRNSPHYKTAWAKVIDTIQIENDRLVSFTLRFPYVRPEALLQVPIRDSQNKQTPVFNGPYVKTGEEESFVIFERNPNYPVVEGRQAPLIIEQQFRDSSDATDALIRGDVDIVDRVPISELKRLRRFPEIEVRSYVVPSVHMLIPNPRNEFVQSSNFRMGLLRGINRELIVNEMFCNGEEISGCEVISGPWPIGTDDNDQLAYGYDLQVRPLDHNLKLGMVLVELTSRMLEDQQREEGIEKPVVVRPPMVLAYPDNFVSSLACSAIAQNWAELGVKVDLRPLENNQTVPPDDDWDFLYVAASVEEPLADAARLLGSTGLARMTTAPIEQSLRHLSFSDSWQSTCATLRRMHRQSANDLVVLPLWQLNEYMAYRNNMREVGRDLIHLYQNVERWRITSTYQKPE